MLVMYLLLYSFRSGDIDVVSSNYTHLITDGSRGQIRGYSSNRGMPVEIQGFQRIIRIYLITDGSKH